MPWFFVWESHTCIHCLWIKSTHLPLPSTPSSPVIIPSQVHVLLFFVTHFLNSACSVWIASQGLHPWRHLTLLPLAAISPQKLCSRWQHFMDLPVHTRILVALVLYKSCAPSHNHCWVHMRSRAVKSRMQSCDGYPLPLSLPCFHFWWAQNTPLL